MDRRVRLAGLGGPGPGLEGRGRREQPLRVLGEAEPLPGQLADLVRDVDVEGHVLGAFGERPGGELGNERAGNSVAALVRADAGDVQVRVAVVSDKTECHPYDLYVLPGDK